MTPTLEATQTSDTTYEVAVRPETGASVTLYVVPARGRERWFVKRSPDSDGFITRHTTFEAAAKSATGRAKRYLASHARAARRRAVAA